MDATGRARRAQSFAPDAREAAREFYSEVAQQDMALVVFFCSVQYDLDILALEMERLFTGVPVIGCTTAGEIGRPATWTTAFPGQVFLPAALPSRAVASMDCSSSRLPEPSFWLRN